MLALLPWLPNSIALVYTAVREELSIVFTRKLLIALNRYQIRPLSN